VANSSSAHGTALVRALADSSPQAFRRINLNLRGMAAEATPTLPELILLNVQTGPEDHTGL